MSDYADSIFDEDDDDNLDLPKKLRKQIKILQQENSSLKDENSSLKGSERKRTLSEALASKGLNPKIAAFVPGDLSAAEIDTWLEEYGDVFGASPAANAGSTEPVIARDAEQAAAIRQMAAVEQGGSPATSLDLLAQIEGAEDMNALLGVLGRR